MRRWWLVPVVLVAVYALTGVVQVRPGERGVVRRFGRLLPHPLEPGLAIQLPWGMDRVDRVAVDRVQSVTVGYQEDDFSGEAMPAGQLLTGDHNLVNVQAILTYKVRPNEEAEFVLQADRVDALLNRAVESVMGQWVAGRTVDDVLLNGKNEMRPVLKEQTQTWIDPYRLGVQILDARVALIAPPDDVKPDFDSVALAQTRNTTLRHTAEQNVARDLRMAEAEKYRLEQETAAYVHSRKLLAQQEADRFLKRLRQYEIGRKDNPYYLRQIWEEERSKLFARLKQNGQIDLLDHHLGANGLDLITAPQKQP
ncbi:MAG TPA: SPFH domain-containing protein [Gemmataceae bacterium]|nr:SPFH domain-containing protein [Gemmataceae bacterium]